MSSSDSGGSLELEGAWSLAWLLLLYPGRLDNNPIWVVGVLGQSNLGLQ